MKLLTRITGLAILLLLAACAIPQPVQRTLEPEGYAWQQLGTELDANTDQDALTPSLALDSSGNPVVSWVEYDGTSRNIYVKRIIANSWEDLGSTLDINPSQSAKNGVIAKKSNNSPVVAWDEADTNLSNARNVYVKQWNSQFNRWDTIGSAVDRAITGNAINPSLATRTDTNEYPVIAWQENNNVYVTTFNGTNRQNVGGILDTLSSNPAITPSLALDFNNLPVVAFAEAGNIVIKKADTLTGTPVTWFSVYGATPLDTLATNTAYHPSLALKNNLGQNMPIVAWYEKVGTQFDVYVKEWNGTAWVALGSALDKVSSTNAKDIVLALRSDNKPIVAWEEAGNIYVKRWTGTSWTSLGSSLDEVSSNQALRPAIDIRSDNNPVVSWQEKVGTLTYTYVKRWTGSSWVLIGKRIDNALKSSLVLKSDNNPILSFETPAPESVSVKRF